MNLQPLKLKQEEEKEPKTKRFIIIDGEKVYITKENMREVGRKALESIKHQATQEKVDEFIKNF